MDIVFIMVVYHGLQSSYTYTPLYTDTYSYTYNHLPVYGLINTYIHVLIHMYIIASP